MSVRVAFAPLAYCARGGGRQLSLCSLPWWWTDDCWVFWSSFISTSIFIENSSKQLENCPWSRIEVKLTASWPWPVTFSFNHLRAMVVTHTHAKDQGQRSVGSKDKVETDGQTDRRTKAIALPAVLGKKIKKRNISRTYSRWGRHAARPTGWAKKIL